MDVEKVALGVGDFEDELDAMVMDDGDSQEGPSNEKCPSPVRLRYFVFTVVLLVRPLKNQILVMHVNF